MGINTKLIGTGGNGIGFGHVSRLRNVGSFFEKRGYKCEYIVNEDLSIRKILEKNVKFIPLDKLDLSKYDLNDNIVIIDSYTIQDYNFENALSVRIDDYCHLSSYSADIIINPNLEGEQYSSCYLSKTSRKVKLLLGCENVLLHPKFLLSSPKKENGKVAIYLGGNDFGLKNKILHLLRVCERLKNIYRIDLVITKNFSKDIQHFIGKKTIINTERESLFDLIKDAEFGISGGGITKYEFAALGIPVLLFAVVDHQIDLAKEMEKRGFALYGGILGNLSEKQITTIVHRFFSKNWLFNKNRFEAKGCQNLFQAISNLIADKKRFSE